MIAIDPSTASAAAAPHMARRQTPCSTAQLRFWFEEQLAPHNPALNVAVRWRIEGELSDAILGHAWQLLAARHAALRTAFVPTGDEPVAVIAPVADLPVRSIDLRPLPPNDVQRAAAQLAEAEARKPFELDAAPLARVTRLLLDERTSEILFTAHHTICDGWSVGILAHEMGTICAALTAGTEPQLEPLPLDYGDFAVWDRERAGDDSLAAQRATARELLRDYTPFEIVPDFPRPPVQTSNGAIAGILIERTVTDAVASLARTQGCTLFMTSYAALLALLHRYSGESDIALGTQVAGRDDVELEGIVGCFINTLLLRTDVAGDPTFAELLERARDTVNDAFEIRELPLESLIDIIRPVRDPGRSTPFSVNFVFQRSFVRNAAYGSFRLIDLPSRSAGALYDLNFFMVERPEGWRIACEYNTDLFETATVNGLLERFCNILRAVAAEPKLHLSAIPVLSLADRHALIVAANATSAPYPHDRTVTDLFAAQAAQTPSKTAVMCGDEALSYAELEAAANRLARVFARHGLGAGDRIGVVLERSPNLIVALLAVAKCGAAYIPLDPHYPSERLAYIMSAGQPAAVVTQSGLREVLPGFGGIRVLVDDPATLAGESTPLNHATADAAAYVIYTSGSTGTPKGVEVGHRSLLNVLCAMREQPGITADDTFVAVTTISFDIAGLEIFAPLMCGATLVIASSAEAADADALARLLAHRAATVMQATPITWRMLVDAGWRGAPDFRIWCGGEALSRGLADELCDRGTVWNLYGPTETTIWSTCARVERGGGGPVPIGTPIANTQCYVVDAYGNLTPPGAPGELCIGGDGVALGYAGRPDLTAERFVPDPFARTPGARMYRTGDIVRLRSSGMLEYLGRRDGQVKIRGFRIELGEVEAGLLREPAIAQAVALTGTDASGATILWAAVVLEPGLPKPERAWFDDVRTRLAAFLPQYMLPALIVAVDALPRTPNGKVDRAALRRPSECDTGEDVRAAGDAPLGPVETTLARLGAELLGRGLGRNDDFFAAGFHSLLAMRFMARVTGSFGFKLPLRTIFDHPTIATFAAQLEAIAQAQQRTPVPNPIVTYNAAGTRIPFIFFHNDLWFGGRYCQRLAAALGPDQPLIALAPHGTAGLARTNAIEAMARDYYLRIRQLVPTGPYRLGGFCAGGAVAYELARLLRESGESVDALILVNASAPPRRAVLCGDGLLRRIGLDARLDPAVREMLCWNIVRLFDAVGRGPVATLRFAAQRLRALRDRSSTSGGTSDDTADLKERGSTETENYFANLIAAYTYHPRRSDAPITLMWGSGQPQTPGDPTLGWSALAPCVRVVPMPGSHLWVLREGTDDLAARLRSSLPPSEHPALHEQHADEFASRV